MDFIKFLDDILKYLQKISEQLGEVIITLNGKKPTNIIDFPEQDDKLIRAGEAARILNVSKATISWYVSEGLLNAYYVAGSNHKKFWLSEVKALAKRRSKFNLEFGMRNEEFNSKFNFHNSSLKTD